MEGTLEEVPVPRKIISWRDNRSMAFVAGDEEFTVADIVGVPVRFNV